MCEREERGDSRGWGEKQGTLCACPVVGKGDTVVDGIWGKRGWKRQVKKE